MSWTSRNLQRQIVHTVDRVGMNKVDSAEIAIKGINPEVNVVKYTERLTSENVLAVITGYDVIVDGTDNFPTRYLLNDASLVAGIPVVHGSIYQFEGSVTVYKPYEGPCYRCQYPEPPPPELAPSCAEGGVLGILPGVIGSLQATEAVKLLLGIGNPLIGRQLRYDALEMEFVELKMRRDPDCPVCSKDPYEIEFIDYEQFCALPSRAASTTRGGSSLSTVRMPPILRQAVGGAREVDASGGTVRELLDDLTARYPAIKSHLLDDGGDLNRFVNVYVNNEDVRLGDGLETAVGPDSTVIVLPAMAGGSRTDELPQGRTRGGALGSRQHAADRAAADGTQRGCQDLRQARGAEPHRLGQGPGRAADDRGGRGDGRARARPADPRTDVAATPASPWP